MSAEDLAYQHLRDGIISGRFPGGMQVRQEYFAEILKMSRMPVRDAIKRLHSDGLLTVLPNRTVIVTQLSVEGVLELYAIKAVLEKLAFSRAIPALKGRYLADVEDSLRRLGRAVDDIELWISRHDVFHNHLYAPCNMPRLLAQIDQLRLATAPYFRMYIEWQHTEQRHGYQHEDIVDELKRGDFQKAEILFEQHVLSAGRDIANYLENSQMAQKADSSFSAPAARVG